jgi:hypothetical protein
MLEITGDDIQGLTDTDLRTLIGLLYEAELNAFNYPTAGVTWGGHQNAPDGGIDVRVNLTQTPHHDGYIPKGNTAFQVKKPDMPKAEIIKEMKPKGKLRDVFKTLADGEGAYIIVSAEGSTAEFALNNRINAMTDALAELPNAANIKVDFYDRGRVAAWVRLHPSMILWIRNKLGRPIQGWQPFGCWANRHAGIDSKYLCDGIRLFNSATADSGGMAGAAGILADGCTEPAELWNLLKTEVSRINGEDLNCQLLRGFLNQISLINSDLSNRFLDEVIDEPILSQFYPLIQTSVTIDEKAVERLKQSLDINVAPISQYRDLAYTGNHESIADKDFCDILKLIALKDKSLNIAIKILQRRIFGYRFEPNNISKMLVLFSQDFILSFCATSNNYELKNMDDELNTIIEACFNGQEAAPAATTLCQHLAAQGIDVMDHPRTLETLSTRQPYAFLDGFL